MSTRTPVDVAIKPWSDFEVAEQLAFFQRNREAFAPWEPTRPPEFFELRGQRLVNDYARAEWEAGRSHSFGISARGRGLVGRTSISNVVRSAFQSAHLGYLVEAALWGQGVATNAVQLTVREAFTTFGLHRIEAAIMPRNVRSIRVAEKCGLVQIGMSPQHLRINGRWEDHILYAITVDEWSARQASAG